jgi:putative transposase
MKAGNPVFRFWQTGGGFDHNIFNEHPLHEVIRYIHQNPVRRGLVDEALEWKWSSARFWEGNSDVALKMDPLEL